MLASYTSDDILSPVWNCNTMRVLRVSSGFLPMIVIAFPHVKVHLKDVQLEVGTITKQGLHNSDRFFFPKGDVLTWRAEALGVVSSYQDTDTSFLGPILDTVNPSTTCQESVTIPTNGQVKVANDSPALFLNRGDKLSMVSAVFTTIAWSPVAGGFEGASSTFKVKKCSAVLSSPPSTFCFLAVSFTNMFYGNYVTVTNAATSYEIYHGSTILLPKGVYVQYNAPGRPSKAYVATCPGTANMEGVPTGFWSVVS